jgi:hypothetical protein
MKNPMYVSGIKVASEPTAKLEEENTSCSDPETKISPNLQY